MKKQQSSLIKIFELITYKKTNRPQTFVLAEMKEGQDAIKPENGQENQSTLRPTPQPTQPGDQSLTSGSGRQRRRVKKKPYSSSQLRSKRSENNDIVKPDIDSNRTLIQDIFSVPENKDLIIREFTLGYNKKAFIAYLDGMADKAIIDDFILRPLFDTESFDSPEGKPSQNIQLESIILTNDTKSLGSIKKVVAEILKGNTALYLDGLDHFLTCETIGYEKRGIEVPKTEGIVMGPQEGFGENLRTNISQLRRIIRNSNLITEFFEVGERSSTTIGIVYLKDLANPVLVKEVRRRLSKIKTDFLVSAGMLEGLIEDNPYAIIPTILSTERPDRTASHIMEGRVTILMDGAPFAMIVPVTMNALMHSPEDAALKWQYTTGLRLIRYIAFLAGSMLPGIYLAFTTFHREMIPTDLLIAIAKAKENVPFPTLVEILLMELSFELIREAGIRVPGIVGNTLGIIGALILGEAAVSANIVSPVLIIIVAVTGLSNFSIPNYSLAFGVRLLRFYYIIAGALLGFYGIALAVAAFTLMMVNLKSFGIPFLSTIAPKNKMSRDKVIRFPQWMQDSRPDFLNPLDRKRQPKIARQWAQEDPDQF